MTAFVSNTLADRFAWLFAGLCKTIGVEACRRGMEAALAWAVWNRVRVLGERLVALAERVRSGRVVRRTPRPRTPHPGPPPQGGREKRATVILPRAFGWVVRALPETMQFAGVLALMLRDAETVALVAKAPEAGRMLRPLCRLLGVQAPDYLRRGGVVDAPPPQEAAPAAERNEAGRAPVLEAPAVVEADPAPSPGDMAGAALAGAAERPPPRPLSWLEQDAAAMRERVARWVARHADPPSTVLPLGLSPVHTFATGPPGFDSKTNR